MKKIIIIVLVLSIILAFLFWKFAPQFMKSAPEGPVNLIYWGLWEDENLLRPVIAEFEKQNPNIKLTYVRQSSINYRTRVQTQIREGVGPDVFRIHNSWLPMFQNDLTPAPQDIFTLAEYKSMFYPVAESSFIRSNNIYAAPMELDGLGLFINEEILSRVGGQIPKTWQEFIDMATKMTVRDATGKIQTAGAALGSTSNVDHWPDIVGLLLMQQPQVNLQNPATPQVAEVFRFYTGFITDPKRKTWDTNLPPSTEAFFQGRLGFYFAPSWRAYDLRQANPNLKFKVVSVPQLSVSKQSGWATFWAEAVSGKSAHPRQAWQFVKFLTSVEAQRLFYKTASQVRLFGEPYSQTSLSNEIINDPVVGAFIMQGPIYKNWYLSSKTYDNGINDEMIKYFEDGVNATLAGIDPQVALQTVAQGVQQVLDKYTKPAPSPGSI